MGDTGCTGDTGVGVGVGVGNVPTYHYSDHMDFIQQGLARVWGEDLYKE